MIWTVDGEIRYINQNNWINQQEEKQTMRKCYIVKILLLTLLLSMGCFQVTGKESKVLAKKQTSIKKVKVGKRISLGSSQKGASYRCGNSRIASVNSRGTVTGKRPGTVKITKKGLKKNKTYTIKVVKNPGKPTSLPVSLDEVSLQDEQIQTTTSGKQIYSARIRNTSKGTIKKVSYYFEIQPKSPIQKTVTEAITVTGSAVSPEPLGGEDKQEVKTKKVTISAKNIAAGKSSGRVSCEGDYTGLVSHMKLTKIDLYTGNAIYRYKAAKGTYELLWASRDKKAPRITGLIKGKSCSGNGDPYLTIYTDQKGSGQLTRFVSAVDDRDGKVKVKADTSKINWKRSGTYTLHFTASDKAGNESRSWAKVHVIVPGTAESIADQVLRSIIRSGWSDEKKARAIYRYVRSRCSYVHNAPHQEWRTTAVRGIRYQSGDCYTYYAVSRLLLTRAGIPNVMINRYPVPRGMRHFWNLVYVSGGWYHFDTTPRQRNAEFCLWTDAQLFHYSSGYTFQFRRNAYVKRAVRGI